MYCKEILIKLGMTRTLELQDCDLLCAMGLDTPFFEGFGFPPAFIPIASATDSLAYYGLYFSDIDFKSGVYVDFLVDESKLYEIALKEEQLLYYFSWLAMTGYYDDEDDEDVIALCNYLGVENYHLLSDVSDVSGESIYKSEIPKYIKKGVSGTSSGYTGFDDKLRISENNDEKLMFSFRDNLEKGNYQEAWNILNSPGWSLKDAKDCFKDLVNKTDSKTLKYVYSEWVKLKHPIDGY